MKTHYALFLLFPCAAIAQPTITNSIIPVAGDVVHYLRSTSGVPIFAGPAQYWDLQDHPFTASSLSYFGQPDTVPCAMYFPQAELASVNGSGSVAEFLRTSGDTLAVVGLCYPVLGSHYELMDPQVVMIFPWTYGDSWEDPYSYVSDGDPLVLDTIRWTASAWGTLRLPGGLELEVVGLHYTSVEVDTVGAEIWRYEHERLDLYAPGMSAHVARFGRDVTLPPWGGIEVYFVTYALDDATLGLGDRAGTERFEVWPLPAHDALNLRWPDAKGTLHVMIMDAMGRVVQQGSAEPFADTATVPTDRLPPGAYVLRVTALDGRSLARMITVE